MRRIFTSITKLPFTMFKRAAGNHYASAMCMLSGANAAIAVVDNTIRQQIINQALNPSYYPINPNTDSDILHHSYMNQERDIASNVAQRTLYQETGRGSDDPNHDVHPPPPNNNNNNNAPPPPPSAPPTRPNMQPTPPSAPRPTTSAPTRNIPYPPGANVPPAQTPAPRTDPSAARDRTQEANDAGERSASLPTPRRVDFDQASTSASAQAAGAESAGLNANAMAARAYESASRRDMENAISERERHRYATTIRDNPVYDTPHPGATAGRLQDAIQTDRGRQASANRHVNDNVGGPSRTARAPLTPDVEGVGTPPAHENVVVGDAIPHVPIVNPPLNANVDVQFPVFAGVSPSIAAIVGPHNTERIRRIAWDRRDNNVPGMPGFRLNSRDATIVQNTQNRNANVESRRSERIAKSTAAAMTGVRFDSLTRARGNAPPRIDTPLADRTLASYMEANRHVDTTVFTRSYDLRSRMAD